ncbi:MAG: Nif3-like dinuclear metal center hexameric protein [Desulfofustis sp.]|nr:Nif3-like dinuclear metal center hexameric protein [Desulfofustis sp.]
MGITIADLMSCLDEIAPFTMAEAWDNVGLIVGDRRRDVQTVLVGLDPTNRLLDEAIDRRADTVITHHPAIFKPIPVIDTAEASGRFLETALSGRLNIIACHTNFDAVCGGVNDVLAAGLGLTNLQPLVPASQTSADGGGMGRIGRFREPLTRSAFVETLLEVLDSACLQTAGDIPETVVSVAVCGGSGSEFAELAFRYGADVYISAEIKHSTARWAEESGFCIVDGTHYATEKPAVRVLADRLRTFSQQHRWDLDIIETETERHPFHSVDRNSYR